MFDNDFRIKGSHATKAKFLCKDRNKEREKGVNIFERLIDVYMLAPVIGLLYGEKSEVDKTSTDSANIMASVMIKEQTKLKYIYRLIMLCDEENNLSNEDKINRAFKDDTNKEALEKNMKLFNSYLLGGIEILYGKFTDDGTTKDDYLNAIYDLVDGFYRDLEIKKEEKMV